MNGLVNLEPGLRNYSFRWFNMKVTNLTENSKVYTSNVYFIRGDWNAIDDINTLIDAGRDPKIINDIKKINAGVGKKQVEKVILTHNHYDHTHLAQSIKETYGSKILAYHKEDYVDVVLKEGMLIKAGDRYLEVIHTPGHTSDSICLWESKQKILFTGDTNINITNKQDRSDTIVNSIRKLARLDVKIIYPGHGKPIINRADRIIKDSLLNLS